MKKNLLIGVIILLAAVYAMPEPQTSLEYMLATIDKGYVDKDDIIIARFRSLLSQLDKTFIENKKQISDLTVGTQEILKKEGIKESLLNIMEGLNSLYPSLPTKLKYADHIVVYIAFRDKGHSHRTAIAMLKDLI